MTAHPIQVQDWIGNRGDEELLRLKAEHQALQEKAMAAGTVDVVTLEA